ncbi:MAG: diamine N-acetyltransferase [Acidobacteriota bacterium]|jgi:ribosomal protein S18 acetylase RimI-like enzyme|nr:diamine N-acetyltransferase [Acidobacteriota bacterium]
MMDEAKRAGESVMVRRAEAGDAALLAELGARTFYETFVESCSPEDMHAFLSATYNVELQAAELEDARATFFIAEVGGQPAGYAKLHAGEPPASVCGAEPVELARLYVVVEWHGRGVGEALMRELWDEARRKRWQTIWLGVWEHNERAKAFYRKWGFEVVGSHVFRVGDDAQTDLLMARAL